MSRAAKALVTFPQAPGKPYQGPAPGPLLSSTDPALAPVVTSSLVGSRQQHTKGKPRAANGKDTQQTLNMFSSSMFSNHRPIISGNTQVSRQTSKNVSSISSSRNKSTSRNSGTINSRLGSNKGSGSVTRTQKRIPPPSSKTRTRSVTTTRRQLRRTTPTRTNQAVVHTQGSISPFLKPNHNVHTTTRTDLTTPSPPKEKKVRLNSPTQQNTITQQTDTNTCLGSVLHPEKSNEDNSGGRNLFH